MLRLIRGMDIDRRQIQYILDDAEQNGGIIIIMTKKLLSLLMLFAIAIVPSALAQEHLDDLNAQPGLIGADSPFHGLEVALENGITNLQFNPELRAERELRLAEERAAEAQQANSTSGIQRAVLARENNLMRASNVSDNIEDAAVRAAVKEEVASSQERHIAVLQEVRERVPEVARSAIDLAISAARSDGEAVREQARSIRRENNVSSEQASIARDRVRERIRNNNEDSDVDDVNSSGVVDSLEEGVGSGVGAAGTILRGSPGAGSFDDTPNNNGGGSPLR